MFEVILIGLIVGGAALYVGGKLFRYFRGRPDQVCSGSCIQCPYHQKSQAGDA